MKRLSIVIISLIGLIGYKDLWGYSYAGYKWDSNPTYYFYTTFDWWIGGYGVGYEIKDAWKHAKKGADVWNDVSSCDFEFKYGGTKWNIGGYRDNVNMVDAWEVPAGAIAIAYVWPSGSRILETDIVFDYEKRWSIGDPCPSDKFDVQNIAAHEFGH